MVLTEFDFDKVWRTHAEPENNFPEPLRIFTAQSYLEQYLENWTCSLFWNKLIRRELVGQIRFRKERRCIDDEFFTYRVLGNAEKLARSSARMYAYRQQPGSAMHKTFSLRRLQGLEAKQQRLEYLRQRMPALEYEAKFDLFFTAMFLMQACLRSLKGEQLQQARGYIGEILKQITPLQQNPEASAKKNLLLKLAQKNFEGTCKLLNFLIHIHILPGGGNYGFSL